MLVNDDMFNLIEYLPLNSVDLIIIDPPYGIGDKKLTHKEKDWNKSAESWDKFDSIQAQYDWYNKVFSFLWNFLKDTGSIFCFGSFHNIYQCGDILQRQLNAKVVNSLVWYKNNAMFNVTRSSLIESCEHCIWAAKGKDFYFDYEYSKHSMAELN
jgi:modification methylase